MEMSVGTKMRKSTAKQYATMFNEISIRSTYHQHSVGEVWEKVVQIYQIITGKPITKLNEWVMNDLNELVEQGKVKLETTMLRK